jgi:dTDP-4-dehydrorhamnose 3,5-epimerase
MNWIPTSIPDVLVFEPEVFGDERGFFMETYNARQFTQASTDAQFVQDNHSGSRQGTLRGLHYQIRQAQGKLIRVVAGEVFDVAVDLRRSSPSFKKWFATRLSAENKRQIWLPVGFAHGFYVLSPWAEVVYKTTDFYAPEWERAVCWDDPELGIEWPLVDGNPPMLSTKDSRAPRLGEAELFDA